MASLTASAVAIDVHDPIAFEALRAAQPYTPPAPSSSTFALRNTTTGEIYTFTGSSFTYTSGAPTGGTITGISFNAGGPVLTISGLTLLVTTLNAYLTADDASGLYSFMFQNADTMTGSSLGDTLVGYDGNDTLYGQAGMDTLDGGVGVDSMFGGDGDDAYYVDVAGDQTYEAQSTWGTDTVYSTALAYTLGTNIDNLVLLGAGNTSGSGNLLNNVITGNNGANSLYGFAGNDTLSGGAGVDQMYGGEGDDTYYVDDGSDQAYEAQFAWGTDTVIASVNFNILNNIDNLTITGSAAWAKGNALNNVITGNANANELFGYAGADTLDGGAGADNMYGAEGNDIYYVDNAGDFIYEAQVGWGTDLVYSAISYQILGNIDNITLTGSANNWAKGNTLNNVVTGNTGANELFGYTGNDTLDGGLGADNMYGAEGDDTYYVDNAGDVAFEGNAAWGTDLVYASVSYGLGANVENLTLTGTGGITGTGNALNNIITGNSGANQLYGNAGADTLDGGTGIDQMYGGDGNDTYYVDNSSDVTYEAQVGWGTDTVYASVNYTIGLNIDNLNLLGAALIGTGNGIGNVITGTAGANTLSGLGGNDTLNGGLGADAMSGGDGDDTVYVDDAGDTVAGGDGTDLVYASVSFTLGADVENLTLQADVNGTGNDSANVINGTSGVNVLSGLGGNDTIYGGLGADTITGGDGNDVIDDYGVFNIDAGDGDDQLYLRDNIGGTIDGGIGNDTVTMYANITNLTFTNIETLQTGGSALFGSIAQFEGFDTICWAIGGSFGFSVTLFMTDSGTIDLASELTGRGVILYANNGNDIITTSNGNDVVSAADGDDLIYASAGNDTYTGGSGTDTLSYANIGGAITFSLNNVGGGQATGNAGTDQNNGGIENLIGTAYNDTISGDANANTLTGGDGDDTILDYGGVVNIDGGIGNDSVYINSNSVGGTINGGDGADSVTMYSAMTGLSFTSVETLQTSGGAMFGTIAQYESFDTICWAIGGSFGFSVTLFMTDSGTIDLADELLGRGATIYAAGGNDIITTSNGLDVVSGGDGDDLIYGSAGNDTYFGDGGTDTLSYANIGSAITFSLANVGGTQATGGAGTDKNNGGIENLTGTAYNDTISGDANANVLIGGDGIDTITDLGGLVSIDAGNGDDLIYIHSNTLGGTIDGGSGTDAVTMYSAMTGLTFTSVEILQTSGNNVVGTAAQFESFDTICWALGGSFGSIVTLTLSQAGTLDLVDETVGRRVSFVGSSGADTITTGASDDILDAGAGADTMYGGGGSDVYVVENVGDTIVDSSGTDLVINYISYTLGSDTENLELAAGTSAINGTGNSGANTLTGNNGANILDGAGGADTITANGGNDTLRPGDDYVGDTLNGGSGTDTLDYSALVQDGIYAVASSNYVVRSAFADRDLLTAGSIEAIIGTAAGDVLDLRSSSIVTCTGGAGDDYILMPTGGVATGGAGRDFYYADTNYSIADFNTAEDYFLSITINSISVNGADTVLQTSGGAITILGVNSLTLGQWQARVAAGGFVGTDLNADIVNGNPGVDFFWGGGGDDTLNGNGGDDSLIGGTGNDQLNGGSGRDRLESGSGGGTLNGGIGDDVMFAGSGDDTFVFAVGDGDDIISGFVAGGTDDTIDLSAYNGSGVTWTINQVGADAVFDFTNGDSITLLGVTVGNLVQIDPFHYG